MTINSHTREVLELKEHWEQSRLREVVSIRQIRLDNTSLNYLCCKGPHGDIRGVVFLLHLLNSLEYGIGVVMVKVSKVFVNGVLELPCV